MLNARNRQDRRSACYVFSCLDLSRSEERALLFAVINNILRKLKIFVVISSDAYEESSEVFDFIHNDLMLVEGWKVIVHPILFI